MKIIIFLLLPMIILAGNQSFKDIIIKKDNRQYTCSILSVDEQSLKIIYEYGQEVITSWDNLNKVILGDLGEVYTAESGLKAEIILIQEYLNKRQESLVEEEEVIVPDEEKDFSFGILYMPANFDDSKITESDLSIIIGTRYITIERSLPVFEGQFTAKLKRNWLLTLNIGYQYSRVIENDKIVGSTGIETLESIRSIFLDLGTRLYLKSFIGNRVRPFLSMSIGKKIAFANAEAKSGGQSAEDKNYENYLEDLNSPFFIGLGFGAEYYFNPSISVTTNLKFYYMTYSAERKIEEPYEPTEISKIDQSNIITRVGIGMHLYF
ncbi:MAG: hypothetical protein JXR46_02220 [Calditrichaceae bacterium]|nr:hypothetical protein [Calditrichaceae bacterium]MBN2707837.1 hypothetical protein [Calditrichaceae bacterium]RQV94903.1 MAG: hypothetical protein EH224_09075 [Calditrichota bacterium]